MARVAEVARRVAQGPAGLFKWPAFSCNTNEINLAELLFRNHLPTSVSSSTRDTQI